MSEEFRFAPEKNWAGDGWHTPEPIRIEDMPASTKPVPVEDDKPFRFAEGLSRKASASGDPFGDDVREPAKRTEFHFHKNLQLDDEDEAEEPGSFRKRLRTDFSVGSTVRWLQRKKTFVITKAIYIARGLYLIHGDKVDGTGQVQGVFSPSELAVLPA